MRRKNITSEIMMDYIAEGLLYLMQKQSFSKITVSDICNKAGVNRSTYYRHFYTKEDIIKYYLNKIMISYLEKYRLSEDTSISNYFYIMFSEFISNKSQLLLIHNAHLSFLLIDVLNKYFLITDDTDSFEQFKISYHIGGIYNNLLLWFSHNMSESAYEMRNMALSFEIPKDISLYLKKDD